MKRIAIILAVLAATGCDSMWVDHQQLAEDQWDENRAGAACNEAAEHLSVGRLEQAERRAREALDLAETYVPARIVLAKTLIEQGNYHAAAAELDEVLIAEPDSAEGVFLLAVAEERLGKLPEALQDYQRAYRLDDTNFNAVLAATEVMVSMANLDEAQTYLSGHLADSGGSPAAYELAGRVAMMREQFGLAAEYYRTAWEGEIDNNDYLEATGLAEALAGDYQRAARSLTARGERGDAPAWVYATLGDCQLALGDVDDAIESYRTRCEIRSDQAASWDALAKAYLMNGAFDEVCVAAERALDIDPTDVDAMCLKGYALVELGRCEQAVRVLAPAVQAAPDDVMLQCLLGRAYSGLGEVARAGSCYRKAVRLEPENAMAWALLREVSTRGAAAR
ncbi:MAG: tetratricopeptide repeat protein [Planctomycetota bacterium]|jgi:tetratricopeptide (TPR) repeat protein